MNTLLRRTLGVMVLGLVALVGPARAQHDHGGMQDMPAGTAMSPEAASKQAREELAGKLAGLQEKIDTLDEKLERTDLKPAKRKKLEVKLQKLLDKKKKLIDDSAKTADDARSGNHAHQH